jgi:hypothetical protein
MGALFGGLRDVLRAPAIIIVAVVAMMLIGVPFAVTLGMRLRESVSHQQPVPQGASEIDAEWWQEFVEHADGLAATFTPMILGFAAPLDNLSSFIDGTHRPLILMIPIATAMLIWAFIWGAALDRFASGLSRRRIWHAGRRTLLPFTAISVLAAALVLVLYYTVHPLLFGLLAPRMQLSLGGGTSAFAGRVGLYLIFGALLVTISLVADYARVCLALAPNQSVATSIHDSWRFVSKHPGAVLGLYAATGALVVVLLALYGAIEIVGDSRVGGWRGIAIAQAYIIARVVIRLAFGASELRLFRAFASGHGASAAFVNAGPPAAT